MESNLRVIYVGRLVFGKGAQDLISACNELWNENDFDLVIVGDGPYRSELEDMVRLSCRKCAHFTGELSRPQVFEQLRKADIFVNPSYSEGLPTSVQEAMSCGLAIIATDVGGTREAVTHAVSGLLFRPHDVDWLSIHLDTLLRSEILRRTFGKRAREAVKKFNWNEITRQYEETLKEVVG